MHTAPVPVQGGAAVGAGPGAAVGAAVAAGGATAAHSLHVALVHSQRFTLSSQYRPPGAHGRLSYRYPLEQLA
jgi:hypothetical protein